MLRKRSEMDGIPSYVTELIRKVAEREGFIDYVITNSAGSNLGDGFQGDLLRFKISGKQNNIESSLSLICKLPSPNPLIRIEFNSDITFRREIYLYGHLLPYFLEFQKEHGISAEEGFNSFPKCYGTVFDEKPYGDHAIVMEDLVASDYSLWNKLKDIDYEHTKMVMEELGKFHAVSFAIREKNPEKLNEIMSKCGNCFHKVMFSMPSSMEFFKSNINKAIGAIEPHETNLIEKLEKIKDPKNYLHLIDQVFSNTTPEPFGVLVHGDLWNNNIMYQVHGNQNPAKVSFIDWQLSQFGSPALDVVHYIFCSLDHVIRAKHYDDFVKLYYNSLVRMLKKFGCDDQKLFKLTDLQDQCRKYGGIVLTAGLILSQIMSSDPETTGDMSVIVQQLQECPENVDAFQDVFGDLSSAYKDRVINMLRDGVREGFF